MRVTKKSNHLLYEILRPQIDTGLRMTHLLGFRLIDILSVNKVSR